MIKNKFLFLILFIVVALFSCTEERPVYVDREFDPSVIETALIASDFSSTNELSNASFTSIGAQTWSVGDEVYYLSDAAANQMDKIILASSGKTPSALITHNTGSKFIAAYYPGENVSSAGIKDYNVKSFGCPGVNPVQSGKICCPAVAYKEIDDATRYMNLAFKYVCSALQFELPEGNTIDKVSMVVNEKIAGNEISGAFKVDMTSASPSAVYLAPFDGSKADSQYEITVATGKKEGVFFMNVLPCTLAQGFTLKLYSGDKATSVNYGPDAKFRAGVINALGDPTTVPAEPEVFTFTTPELAEASGWQPVAAGQTVNILEAEYGDISMTVPENPSGSQNGYVLANWTGWRFYMARNSGKLILNSKSGRNIKSVKFTYSNKNGGVIMCEDNQIDSDVTHNFTTSSSSRTFTCASTTGGAGQYTISAWEITVQ